MSDGSRGGPEEGAGPISAEAKNDEAKEREGPAQAHAPDIVPNQHWTGEARASDSEKHIPEREKEWSRRHSRGTLVLTGIAALAASGSMFFSGAQLREMHATGGQLERQIRTAQDLASAARLQAQAAIDQVAVAKAALDVQREGVAAVKVQAAQEKSADLAQGRSISINILAPDQIEYRSNGPATAMISDVFADGGDNPADAWRKLREGQGRRPQSAPSPMDPNSWSYAKAAGRAIVAKVAYKDARHNDHASFACAIFDGAHATRCGAPADY